MSVDVLIGQSYYLRFDPTLWDAQRPYAPLGSLYAAAFAREAGFRVALFDAMLAESETEWAQALDRERPRVAVIFEDSFNYLSKMCLLRMREAARRMIAAGRARQIPVVIAGSDATDHPMLYLDEGAAAVVVGEGDVTLVEVLDSLVRGAVDLSAVPGVVLRTRDRVVRTPVRPAMRDLDAIPRPAWDLVDVERYRAIWTRRHGCFSMNLATTRGCPYHCNWCAKPIYGQRYAARSPESVADEIAWLKQIYRPDHLWITDDIFGLKPGWIETFADALRTRDAATPFKCLMRADNVTSKVAESLAAAGCRTVWIGAESGSQRILDAMEKGTRVDDIERASRLLRAAGIEVCFFLQFGYPGETRADIELTLRLVDRCVPDDIGISVSYPLPGTPFHERVRAQLGDKQNWTDSSDLAVMYRSPYSTGFYRMLHRYAHARFRVRRGLAALAETVRRASPLDRRRLSHVAKAAASAWRLPVLWLRLRHEESRTEPVATSPVMLPVLTRQAASLPSEQGR